MLNPFTLLGLEPSPRVEYANLQRAFLREAVRFHPDTSAEEGAAHRFQDIQSARAALEDPVENLRAFLEVAAPGNAAPEAAAQLPPDLLELFLRLGALRETLDSLHSRRGAARTPLARALAERELSALQPRLAPVEDELEAAWQSREARIRDWWSSSPPRDPAPLWEILRDLKFLQKWRHQFQGTRAATSLSKP